MTMTSSDDDDIDVGTKELAGPSQKKIKSSKLFSCYSWRRFKRKYGVRFPTVGPIIPDCADDVDRKYVDEVLKEWQKYYGA